MRVLEPEMLPLDIVTAPTVSGLLTLSVPPLTRTVPPSARVLVEWPREMVPSLIEVPPE